MPWIIPAQRRREQNLAGSGALFLDVDARAGGAFHGGDRAGEIVKKRCFLCVGGYEPVNPAWWHQRFGRELERFEKTWNAKAVMSAPTVSDEEGRAGWTVESS